MLNIDREHPEYVAKRAMWKKYRDLYVGGEQMRECAVEYLVRRHKEPNDIYAERLSRVFYENYIGSIIDWYAATLMRREAVLLFEGNDDSAKDFYNQLTEDCDLKRSFSGSVSCKRWCKAEATSWWIFRERRGR